jgi:hypothetical protein
MQQHLMCDRRDKFMASCPEIQEIVVLYEVIAVPHFLQPLLFSFISSLNHTSSKIEEKRKGSLVWENMKPTTCLFQYVDCYKRCQRRL